MSYIPLQRAQAGAGGDWSGLSPSPPALFKPVPPGQELLSPHLTIPGACKETASPSPYPPGLPDQF